MEPEMFGIKFFIFLLASIGIVWVSRSSLRDVQNHGFYRFFAWEFILLLFVLNVNYWFVDPFSFRQMIAWCLLISSLVLIVLGVREFRQRGELNQTRDDPALVGIEKTTALVTSGVYAYIRHPFYSSLLFLAWGIFFKQISWLGFGLGILTTVFLMLTAKKEEVENIAFFGEQYQEYMRSTKMFVPFVF